MINLFAYFPLRSPSRLSAYVSLGLIARLPISPSTCLRLIPAKGHIELTLKVNCDNVRYLEHVQAKVTLTATRRGDIHIYLTSPAGTRATLLAQRPMDNSRSGLQGWPFMSVSASETRETSAQQNANKMMRQKLTNKLLHDNAIGPSGLCCYVTFFSTAYTLLHLMSYCASGLIQVHTCVS